MSIKLSRMFKIALNRFKEFFILLKSLYCP
jgi:hypothetical protein